jgi:hypothetical protein
MRDEFKSFFIPHPSSLQKKSAKADNEALAVKGGELSEKDS